MTRFEKVVQILDSAVGGPSASVGFHGAFWRNISRDEFVAKKVFGLPLITLGKGAESNLVKALRGQTPFGADTGNDEADFNRMPSGKPAVQEPDIAFIQQWIDDGCKEDEAAAVTSLRWRATNAPVASSRTDDVWFVDEKVGWAVNSDGTILHTTDGGDSWAVQFTAPAVYLRCVGFVNTKVGWVGTLSRRQRLLHTADGGVTWTPITNLPPNAPVAVCGISVVSDKVVYASGTNRPEDLPRVIKTTDGGATWTAIDMSAQASILIDCYFKDASHGWVVGGKSTEPTPTIRDRVKPVVLETTDGGATWVNLIADQQAALPSGEWGWKIQFLNDKVGFVSLENLSAAAILKTADGGKTWTRIQVKDPQGNVNLEGVGFIDEKTGWVGGWGPGGFGQGGQPQGLSSATTDGGATWVNANEIGLRINRFRFFGNPVSVGYASGFTIYKYSSTPVPARAAAVSPGRPLLPHARIGTEKLPTAIRMDIPAGTRRLTLRVWDWYGTDYGTILDEVRPQTGPRTFHWDGLSDRGSTISPGDYIVRMTADDNTASSIIEYRESHPGPVRTAARRAVRRMPDFAIPKKLHHLTVAALMQEPAHDADWLRNALQLAIQLELATLPPYLTARWTVKAANDPVSRSIREVRGEEMSHLAVVCNLLVAVGGTPWLADPSVVPTYPGPLPGGVRPELKEVSLRKLTKEQAGVFMDIEYPKDGPIALVAPVETYNSIGAFYQAIRDAFTKLNPPLSTDRQLELDTGTVKFEKLDTLQKVKDAIDLVTLQGEGSNATPEEAPGDLSHYYRFGEIFHGRKVVKDPNTGKWAFNGEPIPLPETWDMADVPKGGYLKADVPDMATWDLIERFDRAYSEMLRRVQDAWTQGDVDVLTDQAIPSMLTMSTIGKQLVQKPKPNGQGNYGPCFRFVS